MIPILYPKNSSYANGDFYTNGIGRLSGAISAIVTEERNGSFELEMDISVGSPASQYIEIGSMIGVKTHNDIDATYSVSQNTLNRQVFEVYDIDKSVDGHITVSAKHYTYRASYIPISEFTLDSTTLSNLITNLNSRRLENGTDVTIQLDVSGVAATKTVKYEQKIPRSLKKCLSDETGCILDLFNTKDSSLEENQKIDLEYEWNNNKIIIHSHRGMDRGAEIRAGKNVSDLQASNDYTKAATGVLPYWTDGKTLVRGAIQYASNVNDFPYHLTTVKDFTSDFKSKPSAATLQNKAQEYLKKKQDEIKPEINLRIDYVDLRQSLGPLEMAQYEMIKLCDIVKVLYPSVGVSYTAKVTKIKWNVLSERIEEIEVGQPKVSFTNSLASALDYTYINGIVDIEGRQAAINDEQDAVNQEQAATNEEQSQFNDSVNSNVEDLTEIINEHGGVIEQINTYFNFTSQGLEISNTATSIKTRYTENGFVIVDTDGQTILAEATADEFNCRNGLGIKDWHFDIDISTTGDSSVLTLYRKREG